jgi:membrane protease YdiL (CAAX protease family)
MQQPLMKQGWLRALLFLIAYLLFLIFTGTIIAFLSLAVPAIASQPVYLSIFINLVASLAMVFLFRKLIDKASIRSLGLDWKGFARERSIGCLTGVFLCLVIALVLWVMQLLQWYVEDIPVQGLFTSLIIMIAVALAEELVFRGYVLNNLMQSMKPQAALLLSAILFAILHSLNPNFNLTAFLNILLAGLLLGINYIFTRNLWFSIMLHLSWNFIQGPVLGFKVSGLELPTLLQQNLRGSILLTGGEFGLEASWLTLIVFAIAIPFFYLLFHKKYKTELPFA